MRTLLLKSSFTILLLTQLHSISFSANKALIENGSFEQWKGVKLWDVKINFPVAWRPWTYKRNKDKFTISQESKNVKYGKYSLKIKTHADSSFNIGSWLSLRSGKKYRLNACVMTRQPSLVVIKFYTRTHNSKQVLSLGKSYNLLPDKWTKIQTIQIMPENIIDNSAFLMFHTKGTYFVDNVKIEEIN